MHEYIKPHLNNLTKMKTETENATRGKIGSSIPSTLGKNIGV
jgi:hypothetical protein